MAWHSSYLENEPHWPESVPSCEDPDWAEKMGQVDIRVFNNEESVRAHFINQLLFLAKPPDAEIQHEFFTPRNRNIRVDYILFDDETVLPVETKYDIDMETFNLARVKEYLESATHGRGLLIDAKAVYEVRPDLPAPKLLFRP